MPERPAGGRRRIEVPDPDFHVTVEDGLARLTLVTDKTELVIVVPAARARRFAGMIVRATSRAGGQGQP